MRIATLVWTVPVLLGGLIGIGSASFAQAVDPAVQEVAYMGREFRNPFEDYFPAHREVIEVIQENVPLPDLHVNGIVWSSLRPLAILNGNVAGVGDVIEGAEIIAISRQHVTVRFHGVEFNLAAP